MVSFKIRISTTDQLRGLLFKTDTSIRGVVVLVLWDPFQHHLLIGSAREVSVMDYQQRSVTAESGVHCVVVLLEACA